MKETEGNPIILAGLTIRINGNGSKESKCQPTGDFVNMSTFHKSVFFFFEGNHSDNFKDSDCFNWTYISLVTNAKVGLSTTQLLK